MAQLLPAPDEVCGTCRGSKTAMICDECGEIWRLWQIDETSFDLPCGKGHSVFLAKQERVECRACKGAESGTSASTRGRNGLSLVT